MKSLVAYFSASGVTAKVAKDVTDASEADLFAIRPEKPYNSADLNWMNSLARCNREKFRKKDVPVVVDAKLLRSAAGAAAWVWRISQ